MQQYNILLFMVDQLTSFVLNAYGGKVCKTPHLNALAARGVVFENAYCPYPLCAPSRFGLMSGRLPSRIGAYDNGAEFKASTPTFAHYLRTSGYYTCIAEDNWPLDRLLGDVIASQKAQKLVDSALKTGREELWDFTPRPLKQNTNYVRRGDAFPTVERRGYLHYPQGRTSK